MNTSSTLRPRRFTGKLLITEALESLDLELQKIRTHRAALAMDAGQQVLERVRYELEGRHRFFIGEPRHGTKFGEVCVIWRRLARNDPTRALGRKERHVGTLCIRQETHYLGGEHVTRYILGWYPEVLNGNGPSRIVDLEDPLWRFEFKAMLRQIIEAEFRQFGE